MQREQRTCGAGIGYQVCPHTNPFPWTHGAMLPPSLCLLANGLCIGSHASLLTIYVRTPARISSFLHPHPSLCRLDNFYLDVNFISLGKFLVTSPLWRQGPHFCVPSISPIMGNNGISTVHVSISLIRHQGIVPCLSLSS